MAYLVEVTLSSSNKETVNFQSREVGVSLTYRLEPGDWTPEGDVLSFIEHKMPEVRAAHALAWQKIRETASVPQTPSGLDLVVQSQEQSVKEQSAMVGWTQGSDSPKTETKPGADEFGGDLDLSRGDNRVCDFRGGDSNASDRVVSDDGEPLASPTQIQALLSLLKRSGLSEWECSARLHERCGLEEFEQLSAGQTAAWLLEVQQVERRRVESLREPTR